MSDEEQKYSIDELAQEIANRVRPAVPIDVALWSTEDIAGYLRRSADVVRERIVCLPTFPKPIRLPANRKGAKSSHPLWKASEVIAWTESHREQAVGRPRKAS